MNRSTAPCDTTVPAGEITTYADESSLTGQHRRHFHVPETEEPMYPPGEQTRCLMQPCWVIDAVQGDGWFKRLVTTFQTIICCSGGAKWSTQPTGVQTTRFCSRTPSRRNGGPRNGSTQHMFALTRYSIPDSFRAVMRHELVHNGCCCIGRVDGCTSRRP